ncbi:MAG: cysteine-rich CWC family protein [Pseudolabrys sp.]
MNSTTADPRRPLSCARCGTTFDCGLGADCWCAAEPFQLPMTVSPVEDCLCPACLRDAAEALVRKAPPRL